MHIGFYTNAYHPTISGVVTSVSSFRKALSELGNNVFIFTPHTENYEDTEPFIFRYPSVNVPNLPDLPLVIPISTAIDHIMPSLMLDVIHSHHPILLGQTAANKSEKMNLPLVFTFHTRYREYSHYFSLNQEFVKEQIDNWLCEYMGKAHHIITPSESMRRILSEEYGFMEQVTTIPTGIDFSRHATSRRESMRAELGWENDIILISVGRLAIEKNWDTLLRSAAQVIQKYSDVRLVIVGEGPEHEDLQDLAHELGIAGQIEFAGKVEPENVHGYLAAADIFCFASVTETQGLVTLEAMAEGLPVAAVEASGTSDAVEDGVQGFLTPNDSVALAYAIERLVINPELRKRMGSAAKIRAREFDILVLAQKLLSVYETAIEDAKAGRYVKCNH
jgi:1,2-diacylglycerol 3-alpha-glucosyltransferase